MSVRIACFISGPYRYCDKVVEQLIYNFEKTDVEFGIFIHLWEVESGSNSRNIQLDLSKLSNFSSVKKIIVEKPLAEEEVIAELIKVNGSFDYGNDYIGHSSIQNMFGMFNAINTLFEYFVNSGAITEYTHVLRLRTDISINANFLPKNIDKDLIYISKNPILQREVSDHSMLVPIGKFNDIWGVGEKHDFIKEYAKYKYNPELYLASRFYKFKYRKSYQWKRYVDYHVVYSNNKLNGSKVLIDITEPKDIFSNEFGFYDKLNMKIYYSKVYIVRRFYFISRTIKKNLIKVLQNGH